MPNCENCSERELREQAIESLKYATCVAKVEIDRRLESMNKLKEQILEERATFVTRPLFDSLHASLENRIIKVELNYNKLIGIGIGIGMMSGITGGILGALLTHLLGI